MKIDRDTLIDMIADKVTNDADLEMLEVYYYKGAVDFLGELSDEELIERAAWVGVTDDNEDEE